MAGNDVARWSRSNGGIRHDAEDGNDARRVIDAVREGWVCGEGGGGEGVCAPGRRLLHRRCRDGHPLSNAGYHISMERPRQALTLTVKTKI